VHEGGVFAGEAKNLGFDLGGGGHEKYGKWKNGKLGNWGSGKRGILKLGKLKL
jgi:hypothetical protein